MVRALRGARLGNPPAAARRTVNGRGGRSGQTIRAARAAFTAALARNAPSTSTEAMVARASSAGTSLSTTRQPGDADVDAAPGGPQLLQPGAAVVLGAEDQGPPVDGLADRVVVGTELV